MHANWNQGLLRSVEKLISDATAVLTVETLPMRDVPIRTTVLTWWCTKHLKHRAELWLLADEYLGNGSNLRPFAVNEHGMLFRWQPLDYIWEAVSVDECDPDELESTGTLLYLRYMAHKPK